MKGNALFRNLSKSLTPGLRIAQQSSARHSSTPFAPARLVYSRALLEVLLANGSRFVEPCSAEGLPLSRKGGGKGSGKGGGKKPRRGEATLKSADKFGVNEDKNFML